MIWRADAWLRTCRTRKGSSSFADWSGSSAKLPRRSNPWSLKSLEVLELLPLVDSTLDQDPTTNWREAILDIYKRLRPGEAANEEAARQLIYGLFFDVKRYDLGKVGRRFLNQRLGIDVPLDIRNLTADDLSEMLFAMDPYLRREAERDDIDDLKNKRVRSVGELLQQQLRLGFVRMEKVARERMTSTDQENLLPGIISALSRSAPRSRASLVRTSSARSWIKRTR